MREGWGTHCLFVLAEGWASPLTILPVTLGRGKRLFADGTITAAFKVTESTVTSKGVILVHYERAGSPNRKSINIRPDGLGF